MKRIDIESILYTRKKYYLLIVAYTIVIILTLVAWSKKGYDIWFALGYTSNFIPIIIIILIFAFSLVHRARILRKKITLEADEISLRILSKTENRVIPFNALTKIVITKNEKGISSIAITSKNNSLLMLELRAFTEDLAMLFSFISQQLEDTFQFHSCTLQGNKNLVAREYIYHPKIALPSPSYRQKLAAWIIMGIILFFIVAMSAFYFITQSGRGKSIHGGEPIGKSEFELYEGKIYFHHKEGKGYFELNPVDTAHFRPFVNKDELKVEMGSDGIHIFYGNHILQGINANEAVYLGRNYILDNHHVFFRTSLIPSADISTFRALEHINNNTLSFSYAIDKQNIYYQNKPLALLDPMSIKTFPDIFNHVGDHTYVYYKDRPLEGLDANKTTVQRVDYRLYYTTDHQSHFINGIKLPTMVDNILWGQTQSNNVHLLSLKHSGSAHILFYDENHIYYFDEFTQTFKTAKPLAQKFKWTKIDEKLLSDGQFIYFTERKKIVRKRRSGYNIYGDETILNRLDNVKAEEFKKIKEIDGTPVYSDGKNMYISMRGYGNYFTVTSSLYLLKHTNFRNEHQIKASDIAKIDQKTKILTIRTQNKTHYDDNDE